MELVLDTEPPAVPPEPELEPELLEPLLVVAGDATDVIDVEVVGDELEVEMPPPGSTVTGIEAVVY